MEPQNRNLFTNMTGDDVALLHIELQKLGFHIQASEIKNQRFGRSTGEAVRAFQKRHGLSVTGKVDERTVTLINREVAALKPRPFVVRGSVKNNYSEPLNALVRAFDKDLRTEQPLGETRTDAKGQYCIEYSAADFIRAEKNKADLIVRAFDEKGRLLTTSEVLFNAPPDTTIDLIGKPPVEEKISEFERIVLELQPLLDGVTLAELSSDDVAFLVEKTRMDRERIIILARSALLARETALPTEVFYGLARMGLKLELDTLLREKPALIRKTLQAAIKEEIIPATLADSLDKTLERWRALPFEQGLEVAHEIFIELLDEQRKTPLANYNVNALDLDAPEEPKDLGATITDNQGRFAVSYTAPKVETTDDEVALAAERRLKFVVRLRGDAPPVAVEVTIKVGNREIVPVLVAIPVAADDSPTLVELKDSLKISGIDELITHLADKGINSLHDIRAHGKIAELTDLPSSVDAPSIRVLEAHANLNVLSNDVDLNQKLIDNGLSSVVSIAGRPRADFVSLINTLNDNLTSPLDDLSAARLHAEAKAGTDFLNNVVTGFVADVANGIDSPIVKALPALTQQFTTRCSCHNCESAVSPLAYLSDLLDYATTHLKQEVNGALQLFTIQDLDNRFHQPFGEFSVDCDLVEEKLPQVRLCVEVLRSFTESPLVNELPGEAEYRLTAYRALLAGLGTSYEELRAARSDEAAARERLANRLGIAVGHLNELPLNPGALTEVLLERLFGLRDTTRDVLSQGAKIEDTQDQLKRWSLKGAEWNRNTDKQGLVHLALSQPDPAEDRFVIEVFRDRDSTKLVASGERIGASGSVVLATQNGSQLHGTVEIAFSGNDTMALSLVPLVLSRRYTFLRDQWLLQDHPVGGAATGSYPLIDPDIVSLADLKSPNTADPAFLLWQARRQLLEGFLNEIQAKRRIDILGNINLRDTIESELGENVASLETLRSQLVEGEEDAVNNILLLGLEPAGLKRLLVLLELLQNNGNLLETELNEFDSILVQARKVKLFDDWRDEERLSNITLSPDHFRITLEEQEALPLWRATRRQRRDWLRLLTGRIEQEQATREQLIEAVGKAEQTGLMNLRDSLLLAPQIAGDSLEAKADWVTHNLLIDAHTDICMRTTRIAQAVETLQGLIEAGRRGTTFDTGSTLSLNPDNFDEEWQWLGSYETWRSAMLLFLYPENLLLPNLRTGQTPGFKQLIKTIRGQRRLTPEQACHAAYNYSQYFQDVCSLQVETSCRAKTLIHKDVDCRGRVPIAYQDLDYFFGRGSETQTVYWSSYKLSGQCGQEQSYWAPVPNLENVERVIGAVPYGVTSSESYICLFVQVREDDHQELKLIRYRLEQQRWDEEPRTLDLPERNDIRPTRFSAVVRQRSGDRARPHLAIFTRNTIYDRKINHEATDWDENPDRDEAELLNDWSVLVLPSIGRSIKRLWSMVDLDGDNYYLLVKNRSGQIQYRLIGSKDDGYWHPQFPELTEWKGEPVGAFGLGTNKIYAFWKQRLLTGNFSSDGVLFSIIGGRFDDRPEYNPEVTFYRTIKAGQLEGEDELVENFADFEQWLGRVTGFSLAQTAVTIGSEEFPNLLDFFTPDSPDFVMKVEVLKAAEDIGIKVKSGEWGFGWRWVDLMVVRMSNAQSLGDVLLKLVENSYFNKNHNLVFKQRKDTLSTPQQSMSGLDNIAPSCTPSVNMDRIVVGTQFTDTGTFRTVYKEDNNDKLTEPELTRLVPLCSGPFEITEQLSDADRSIRGQLIKQTFNANANGPRSHRTYLEEAYYFVPVYLALQLSRRDQYESALDWFRTVYDYTQPEENRRKIYYGLILEQTLSENYQRASDWLDDPLNPHAIAATRANSYTRFTQLSIVQCLLDFADAEFTRDTAESVARARTLYLAALRLLDDGNLGRTTAECQAEIDSLDAEVSGEIASNAPQWQPLWNEAKSVLAQTGDRAVLETTISAVRSAIAAPDDFAPRMIAVLNTVSNAAAKVQPTLKVSNLVSGRGQKNDTVYKSSLSLHKINAGLGQVINCAGNTVVKAVETVVGASAKSLANTPLPFLREPAVFTPLTEVPGIRPRQPLVVPDELFFNPLAPPPAKHRADAFKRTPHAAMKLTSTASLGFMPSVNQEFCVPQNPIPSALRLHAQLNLFKIRNCRNIAGDERALEPYSAPVDVTTGLPSIGSGGEIVIARQLNLPPTPYRYRVLVERAKQMEAAFLSALEKRDAEFYNLIRARQEVRLARAGVRLQDLRVKEAGNGVTLTELQRERAEIQEDHFQDLLNEGLLIQEELSIFFMKEAALLHALAGSSGGFSFKALFENGAGAISSFAAALSTTASIFQTLASNERREQGWRFQKNLAEQDVRIGNQQIKLAKDRVRIVGQERTIADIQTEHANQSVEFLANKFTNAELYEFMSEVLEGVYSYFLQQATSVARLAERQLAFERQEVPPPMIQSDYWEAPLGLNDSAGIGGETPDRRGITGSARLLQDITKLDQFAFQTDERKLQLTKTLSLAQLAPAEFQRFRESGVLLFTTPMALFDQDFPGHYLRLIKRVRTSVIALTPPTKGIKSSLATNGISRVVIDAGGSFQTVDAHRPPESVALTSPRDASGLFELLPQSQEKLFPFEGMGVDTSWELQLPKAANFFDYSTIADVMITIEYTALNSFDYRRQVIKQLDQSISAERPFSFRNEFADQWYELHNPEQPDTPLVVSITTRREDFLPNIEELKIQHIVLFFSLADGAKFEVPITNLSFKHEDPNSVMINGNGATTVQGVVSTRRGNGGGWTDIVNQAPDPFGTWTLSLLDNVVKNAFRDEKIEDILFVITYTGQTSEWPA